MSLTQISFAEGEALLEWIPLTEALAAGHRRPKAEIDDTFLYRGTDTLLSRSAWIDGLGIAVKTATIFPGNEGRGLPGVNGGVSLFSDQTGELEALVDFHLVTKWKTAGDSLLGARKLANPESREILIIGAGTVAGTLIEAFSVGFPDAQIRLWNRTRAKAEALTALYSGVTLADRLPEAVTRADIVLTCTMSPEPVIKGDWLRPGQHLNLIGAYRPDMREADDRALQRCTLYNDSFDTTLNHIGEFKIPLAAGTLQRADIRADFYALDRFEAYNPDEMTLFKNGGGAHLDLMTSRHVLDLWTAAT